MSRSSWREALDDWEAFLTTLQEALDRGEWSAIEAEAVWAPPANLTQAPTAQEQQRALGLADRAGRLRERLEFALRDTAEELSGERRKTHAAVSYLRQDAE